MKNEPKLSDYITFTRPFHVFDFETTGVDRQTARVCQIGIRTHYPDGSLDEAKTLVNPGISMPRGAEETHKISDRIIAEGCARCWAPRESHPVGDCPTWKPVPTFAQLAAKFYERLRDGDYCGQNIRFDLGIAQEEFGRLGLEFDYSKSYVIDTHRLWSVLEPRSLSDAVDYWVKKRGQTPAPGSAHDALTDVRWAEQVFIGQLMTGQLPSTLLEIHDKQWPRDPNAVDSEGKFLFAADGLLVFGFGKHKGKPVARDLGYVKWMLGGSFSPEVKRICQAVLDGQPPRREA